MNAPTAPQHHPEHNPLRAALWMTGAITSFSAMAIAVRELKGAHDTFEIMAVRSLVGLVIVLAAALATGRLGEIRAHRLGGHVLRNAIHFTGQNLWILAVTLIPLAQVDDVARLKRWLNRRREAPRPTSAHRDPDDYV